METFSDTCVLAPSVTSTVTSKDITHLLDLGFDVEQLDLSLFEVKKEGYEDKQPPFYENAQLDSKAYTSLPPYPSAIKSEASSGGGMLSPPPMVVSSDMSSSSPPMEQSVFQHPGCHRSLSDMNIGYEMQVPESSVHSKSQSRYIPKNSSSSDRQFTAADSNSSTPPKSFIACKVCGDKASGYHYGVTSCEGCKGFFRRSIQKQIEYRCLREGKCLVIRLNRNRCQFCRFKKCLSVGMSRDSVRYGRVPKRSRERNDESRVTQSEVDQCFQDQENKEVIMYDLILTVSQAHHANCAYTEEKTRGLVRKPAMFNMNDFQSNPGDVHVTADSLEQQKINVWQQFSVFLTPSIQRIVEFAKRVPGFSDLAQDDQIILVKFAFFEIWLVHVARMVNTVDNTITFYDGSYISQQHLELIFDHDFVSQIFNFVASFNNLQLEDSEIGLYSAVVLLTCDRPGIYDNKAIQQQQEKLMEALKIQVSRNHPSDMHVFHSLIAKLPELNNIGEKHLDHLRWYRENWVRLRIPPLFAEVFDIPKSDVELAQR